MPEYIQPIISKTKVFDDFCLSLVRVTGFTIDSTDNIPTQYFVCAVFLLRFLMRIFGYLTSHCYLIACNLPRKPNGFAHLPKSHKITLKMTSKSQDFFRFRSSYILFREPKSDLSGSLNCKSSKRSKKHRFPWTKNISSRRILQLDWPPRGVSPRQYPNLRASFNTLITIFA